MLHWGPAINLAGVMREFERHAHSVLMVTQSSIIYVFILFAHSLHIHMLVSSAYIAIRLYYLSRQ